jgi:hypothetical protein
MKCELVCTGWYSNSEPRSYQTHGDEFIRGRDFRPLWWKSVDEFVRPEAVLVVDSASPIKPKDDLHTNTKVMQLNLLKNPGHSQNCAGHYGGWTAGIICGMEYAVSNDVDFFIYIEQDALVYGGALIEKIRERIGKADLLFGKGEPNGEIDQTIFAVSKRGLRKFISEIHRIDFTDRQISPEMKFMYASSPLRKLPLLGLASWDQPNYIRRPFSSILRRIIPKISSYELLPFGYGRRRPINFEDDSFYFQQGTAVELHQYRELSGF